MLALIAGQGGLPGELVAAVEDRPLIAALDGFSPDAVQPDIVFRIEHLGSFIAELTARGVTEVCFAGAVRRPPIDQSAIDAATLPLVPRIAAAIGQGDDAVLRTILQIFEDAGFHVVGASALAPALLPRAGLLVGGVPAAAQPDIARARAIHAAMGTVDTGQALVVHKGQALALEGLFGTDWMLASLAARPDGRGGVLFKAPKAEQDRRVDLPTIGPDTVSAAAAAGLDGIVIEADGVLVLGRDQVVASADSHGLFVLIDAP
ncbi:MAG: UDP-2,3-diacylglucosamine diphosphatase LpxI [Pseudomonadota bacterium]